MKVTVLHVFFLLCFLFLSKMKGQNLIVLSGDLKNSFYVFENESVNIRPELDADTEFSGRISFASDSLGSISIIPTVNKGIRIVPPTQRIFRTGGNQTQIGDRESSIQTRQKKAGLYTENIDVSISPNPFKTEVVVCSEGYKIIKVELFNLSKTLVYSEIIEPAKKRKFNLSLLKKGNYIINVTLGNNVTKSFKIIKN